MHHLSAEMKQAVETIAHCARVCEECATHCIDEGNQATCAGTCLDCARICIETAAAIIRGSHFTPTFVDACSAICEGCADECAAIADGHALICATVCRDCAKQCREMSLAVAI